MSATTDLHPYASQIHAAGQASSHGPGSTATGISAWDGSAAILRPIPGTGRCDAAGPYPLTFFQTGWDMQAGLEELRSRGAVSAVFVSDPLGAEPMGGFGFRRGYKRHYLVTPSPGSYAPCPHHRARIRKASRSLEVTESPLGCVLQEWTALYAGLVSRKGLGGTLHDFTPEYFRALAGMGARAFAARDGIGAAAISVWVTHGARGYYHLAAASDRGRRLGAAHLCMDGAIRALGAQGMEVLLLGAGTAAADEAPCGLDRFKAGFASASRVNQLLGAVLDEPAFHGLSARREAGGRRFPPYRFPQDRP